jgi:ABC-type multidrug transport system fused ATPase/permease subunit
LITNLAEFSAVYYTYLIGDLIRYIKSESSDRVEGIKLVATFILFMVAAQVFRNRYMFEGIQISLKIRRTLVAALFDKVVKLSMKSMTETNSGKLISLISSDLFTIERGLAIFPILFAAPFINGFACFFLARAVGVKYTMVVLGLWIFTMVLQYWSSVISRRLTAKQSHINDQRLNLVNDLVVGARTIKCYGWENHYVEKINKIREEQVKVVINVNIV